MKKAAIVGIIAATVLASGCAHRVADLTVGSTKNYNIMEMWIGAWEVNAYFGYCSVMEAEQGYDGIV